MFPTGIVRIVFHYYIKNVYKCPVMKRYMPYDLSAFLESSLPLMMFTIKYHRNLILWLSF